jgi:YD repeat-containing protein
MSSLITSAELGFFGAHKANQNLLGGTALGQRLNHAAINLATGNLSVQRQDQLAMARGENNQLVQTYNSLGQDANGDNWWLGSMARLTSIPLEHKTGSLIVRRNGDGSQTEYLFDNNRGLYVATDGEGSHDTLKFDATQNVWIRKNAANSQEIYHVQGRLTRKQDAHGQSIHFTYSADKLVQITDASGQVTNIDYIAHSKGARISAIRTTVAGAERTDARFEYDTLGRLTRVQYDLTPDDNNIGDNQVFSTRYTYDADSHRLASITNSDGSSSRFSYKQHTGRGSSFIAQGAWVLASMTNGEGRTVTFDYDAITRSTDVTDEHGQITSYRYDAKGQLLSIATPPIDGTRLLTFFSYDADGNLISKKDSANKVSHYQYDSRGNLLTSIDAKGRRIDRRYNSDDQLIAEIRYQDIDPDGTGAAMPTEALVTRYIYDDNKDLRFVVNADGSVSQHIYNSLGQKSDAYTYLQDSYNIINIDKNTDLSFSELTAWAATKDINNTQHTRFEYDFRGQLSHMYQYDGAVVKSASHYVYDYAGRLLSQTDGTGASSNFVYDGMGRRISSQNSLGEITLISYDDAAQQVHTLYASGKLSTSVYNRAGDLIEQYDSLNNSKQNRQGYVYDDLGRLRISESANGARNYYFYDANNRKTGQINEFGQLSTWTYNKQGAVVRLSRHSQTVDPRKLSSGQGQLNEALWNLTSFIQQAAGNADSTEYRIYDDSGLLRFLLNSTGTVTEHTYDGLGALTHKAVYEKQLQMANIPGDITENKLIALLYDLKVASINNDVITTGRDPVQPYQYLNHAQLQDRFLDTQILGISKTGGFEARNPNQPYGYVNGADHPLYVVKDSVSEVEQTRLADGRQALSWTPNSLAWPKVEIGYRILHNNDQFEYLPTSFSNGQYAVELPQLARDEYEITILYKDAYNQVRSQSGGAFTQLRQGDPEQKTIQVKNFESYWTVSAGSGSSLSGVIPAHLFTNLEKVTAKVYLTDSDVVRTDLNNLDFISQSDTLASAYPAYQGQVNLSLGDALLSGRYQIHLTLENKDGSTSSLAPFLYEIGSQSTGLLSQTLTWPLETFESSNSVHSARYRSGYRNTEWTSIPVSVVDGNYQIKFDELQAGQYYEVELVHQQGALNYHGVVENKLSSTFLFQANDVDSLVDARMQKDSISDQRVDGSAITGVYTPAEAANIDYVLADVFDKASGKLITSAYTYMSSQSGGLSNINLSTEKPLENGQYRIELRAYHRGSSSQSSTKLFDYEIGQQQETTRPSIVSITLDDLPDNAEPFYFFPQLNGARYQKGTVNENKELVISVNDLFVYDTRQVPDGLFDMFIQYRDKQTGEMIDRYFTQVKINYESHDSIVSDFDNPLVAPKGKHEQFYHDSQGRLVGTIAADGALSEYKYDKAGQLVEQIQYAEPSVYGSSQSFEAWDAILARQTSSNADQTTRFIYDKIGRKVAEIDAEGYLTSFKHDAVGRVITQQRFAAQISDTTQDLTSLLALMQGISSQVTHYTYDALGRITQEQAHTGVTTTNSYDKNGALTSQLKYDSRNNDYQQGLARRFDALGRVTAQLDAIATEKLRTSSNASQQEAVWQQHATFFSYDNAGRVIHSYQNHAQVKNSQTGQVTSSKIDNWFYYNGAGQLVYTVDDQGVVAEKSYDAFGRQNQVRRYFQAINTQGLTGGTQLVQVSQRLVLSGSDLVSSSSYDTQDRLSTATDIRGLTSSISYDVYGRVASRFTPDSTVSSVGVQVNYQYDAAGRLTQSTEQANGLSKTVEHTYDAFGRQIESRISTGGLVTRRFDKLGREIQQTNAAASSQQVTYDAFSRAVSVQDALGRVTQYIHDDASNSVTIVYPGNIQVQRKHDGFGNQLSITDAKNNLSLYSYDELGRTLSSIHKNAAGVVLSQTSSKFNSQGLIAEQTEANGSVNRYYYDSSNNSVEQVLDVNGVGLRTLYAYDALGRQIEVTQADGIKTRFSYDTLGQMVEQVINVTGTPQAITRYSYDARGNKITQTNTGQYAGQQQETHFKYDSHNRLIEKIEDPLNLNRHTRYSYNANGKMVHSFTDGGMATYQVYDELGLNQLLFSIDQSGKVTEYKYDATGQKISTLTYAKEISTTGLAAAISSVPSPRTEVQQRLHDRALFDSRPGAPQGQLTELNDHDLSLFDNKGNQVFSLNANGYLTQYYYDANGNNIGQKQYKESITALLALSGSSTVTLADVQNLLASQTPESSLAYYSERQIFDGLNRLQYSIDSRGYATYYEYNPASQLIRTTRYSSPTSINSSDLSQVLKAADLNLSPSQADTLTQTLYDGLGRQQLTINSEGFVTEYVYDTQNRVTQTLQYKQSVTAQNYQTVASVRSQLNPASAVVTKAWYDNLGNALFRVDSLGYLTALTYDDLGRVTRTERTSVPVSLAVNADEAAVRLAFIRVPGPTKRFNQIENLTYDSLNRLISSNNGRGQTQNFAYDINGNKLYAEDVRGLRTYFSYDINGRISRKLVPISDTQGKVVDYQYNAKGMLVNETHYSTAVNRFDPQGAHLNAQQVTVISNSSTGGDSHLRYDYDAEDRLVRKTQVVPYLDGVTAQTSLVTEFSYNHLDQMTEQVSHSGTAQERRTQFAYDGEGQLVREIKAAGTLAQSITEYRYDAFGNQTHIISANGVALAESDSQWALEARQRLGWVVNGAQGVRAKFANELTSAQKEQAKLEYAEITTYDEIGRALTVTDANGARVITQYNALGGITRHVNPAGQQSIMIYDDANRVHFAIDALGVVSEYEYTARADIATQRRYQVALTGGYSAQSSIADIAALVAQRPGQSGRTTSYVYDNLGQVVQEIDPMGQSQFYEYDAAGNVSAQIDKNGNRTEKRYDALNRLIELKSPQVTIVTNAATRETISGSIITRYQYNVLGQRVSETKAVGTAQESTTGYEFDALGREVKVIYPSRLVANGNNGAKKRVYPTETRQYDLQGNLLRSSDNLGRTQVKIYDQANRLTHWVDASNVLRTFDYNSAGSKVTERIYHDKVANVNSESVIRNMANTGAYQESRYLYDDAGRLVGESKNDALYYDLASGFSQSNASTRIVYNLAGKEAISIDGRGVSQYTYYDANGLAVLTINGDGYVSTREYDANGNNVKEVVYSKALTAGQIASLSANTPVSSILPLLLQTSDNRTTVFSYDALNRVVEQQVKNIRYSTPSGSNVTNGMADVTTRYQYDSNGNVTVTEVGGIKNNLWVGEKTQVSFQYDALNRQIKSTDSSYTDFSNQLVTPTRFIAFDAMGNQVLDVQDNSYGAVGTIDDADKITTRYYDDSGRLVRITAPGDIDIIYIHDQYGNVIVKREKQTYLAYQNASLGAHSQTRWLVERYSYDDANRQVWHQDANDVTHSTRYNTLGQVVAKGTMGNEHTFYEYDANARLTFSNDQGKHRRFFYDENGNATLVVTSTGTRLDDKSMAWMLAANKQDQNFHFTVNRFDARNNAIESIDPELAYLRAQANAAPATGNVPSSNFSRGAAQVAMGGNIDVKFHLMASGSDRKPEQFLKQYGMTFTFDGMDDYSGKLRLEWDTGFAGYGSQGVSEVDISKNSNYFQGINSPKSYISGRDEFNRYGVKAHGRTTTSNIKERGFVYSVKTFKQDAQGNWVFYKNLTGSYGWEGAAPEVNQYTARSNPKDSHSVPALVSFSDQPAEATRLSFYYRAKGSTGAFSKLIANYGGNGRFAVDVSSLGQGEFEYYYQSNDSIGKVINGAKGMMTLGAQTQISHTNTVKPDLSLQSLQVLSEQGLSDLKRYASSKSQSYNAFGQISSITDGRGYTTNYVYDNRGQLIQRTDPTTSVTAENGITSRLSVSTRYAYDIQGNQVSEIDANGQRQVRQFQAGKLVSQSYADNTSQSYNYDIYGQMRSERTKDNRFVSYSYDGTGQIIQVDRAGRNDDTYVYNQQGQQLKHETGFNNVATGNANVSYFEYDRQGRLVRGIDPAGFETQYNYSFQGDIGSYGGWIKQTVHATGDISLEHNDYLGRMVWKQDMGGTTSHFYYGSATGQLDLQVSSRGQDIRYSYYENGLRKQIDDIGANNFATFNYDANGNTIGEEYFYLDAGGSAVYSQQTVASFDELNRLSRVSDSGLDIRYDYDAVGNRRRIRSDYTQINNISANVDHWYTYDAVNRVVISKGDLENGQVVRGDGVKISYDSGGRRKTVENGAGSVETYTYNAFGWLMKVDIDGDQRVVRSYYDGGYLKSVQEYRPAAAPVLRWRSYNSERGRMEEYGEPYLYYPGDNRGQLASDTSYIYNAAGQKITENVSRYDKDGTNTENANSRFSLDKLGNQLSSSVSTSSWSDNKWHTTGQTTRYGYEKWDTYKQVKIEVAGQTSGELRYDWGNGLSKLQYDVNGNLVTATDTYAGRLLKYVNSFDGKVLVRKEETPRYTKQHNYFYFNGIGIGDIGDDGPSYRDYATVLADAQRKKSTSNEQEYRPVIAADFDANYVPVGRQSGVSSGSYSVQAGDSLMGIAAQLWGDKSLWYLLADANGLRGTERLAPGATLTLPNVTSTNLHHSAETFRPYNPGAAMGDVNPTLPEIPPPPIPPQKGGCGGIAMIVMVVVAVVATVFTAGAALLAMAPGATIGGVLSGAMTAGMGIMSGAAGLTTGIAAAAFAGGFVGSAASQLVGKAMGVVDSFSLKKALVGGVTSMATVGLATGIREVAGIAEGANLTQAAKIWQAGLSVPANVGINQLAGIDTSFSWGNVAVSVLSTAAMTTDTMASLMDGIKLGGNDVASFDWGNTVKDTAVGIVGAGVSYALGKAILKGVDRPSWNFKQVAMSAFGNAVGSEINRSQAKAGLNRVEMEKNIAAFIDKVSKQNNANAEALSKGRQKADVNNMTKQLAPEIDRKLAAQNQAIEASNEADVERMQNGRQSIAEKANATSAELKADLAALTERHEAQMFKVNETLANAKMLLGEGTEISLTDVPVPNDVVPRGPWTPEFLQESPGIDSPAWMRHGAGQYGPWRDEFVFPYDTGAKNVASESMVTQPLAFLSSGLSEFNTGMTFAKGLGELDLGIGLKYVDKMPPILSSVDKVHAQLRIDKYAPVKEAYLAVGDTSKLSMAYGVKDILNNPWVEGAGKIANVAAPAVTGLQTLDYVYGQEGHSWSDTEAKLLLGKTGVDIGFAGAAYFGPVGIAAAGVYTVADFAVQGSTYKTTTWNPGTEYKDWSAVGAAYVDHQARSYLNAPRMTFGEGDNKISIPVLPRMSYP